MQAIGSRVVPTLPVGTRLPGACWREGWDAHFGSPWQRVKRAGHFHWHRHWKKASTHLRDEKKKKEPLTLRNIPWFPLIEGFPVEGRDRTDTRETIPAEEFSDSRTTCGAERRQTGRKEGKQKWLRLQGTSTQYSERRKSSAPLPDTKCPQSRWPNYHRNPL